MSILASLLVSLTVTPVLSYYLLPQSKAIAPRRATAPLLRALKWLAGYLIRFSMARAGLLLLLTWVLVGVLRVAADARSGADFLPPFDEGSVQVNVTLPPGSSLEASNEVAGRRRRQAPRAAEVAEQPERRDPALRPPHRPGRAGRARRAGQRQRVHPEHQPGLRAAAARRSLERSCRTSCKDEVPGRGHRGRAAAGAPDQPHALRRVRPDRHQGLRRRPGHAAAAWPSRSRRRSPTCPA